MYVALKAFPERQEVEAVAESPIKLTRALVYTCDGRVNTRVHGQRVHVAIKTFPEGDEGAAAIAKNLP